MRTLQLLLLLAASTLLSYTANTQNDQLYMVHTVNMQEGQISSGMDLGKKYFSGSLEKLGVETLVLSGLAGGPDGLILVPVPADDPFKNYGAAMHPHMLEIAGSETQLQEDMARFSSGVIHQSHNIYRAVTTGTIDDTPFYQLRFIKYKYGKKDECVEIGMKYFNKNLEMLNINNMVLSSESGPWDIIVLEPKNGPNPLHDPHAEQFGKNVLQIAGSQAQLEADMKKYSEGVLREDIAYFKRL